ncbi:hypothetical protein BJ684DRAFT_34, partial [Piptocephalis cylindrospora]
LGCIYYWGLGVPQDREEAVKQWEMIEMGEDIRILQALAYCYITGEGKEQDVKRGMGLLLENKGHFTGEGCVVMAFLHSRTVHTERDGAEALRISNLARTQNYGRAAFLEGRLYEEGLGVEQKTLATFFWYKWWCDDMLGNLEAQVSLGRCMIKGEGVEKNVDAGLELWERAAVRGSGEAHLCLYEAYSQGEWTDVN